MSVVDRKDEKKASFYHFLNASILVGLITAVVGLSLYSHLGHEFSQEKFVTVHGKTISADTVRDDIKEITKFGPRIFPSQNHKRAGEMLMEKLKQKLANKPKDSMFDGEVEFFKADGNFNLTIIQRKTKMGYKNIPNIILTLRPKLIDNQNSASADSYCMYNCHYDSVNGSPGASDNAINCALMMNLADYFLDMRVSDFVDDLTDSKKPKKTLPQCNLLFLFNGAEETCMAAVNSFVTKHNLKDKIKTLINLDSSGTGGRAALFQATPGATLLMRIYAESVPHPYGSVIGEEVFRTGLLPVDTDFQIFRDYGHLEGLDIAFIGNGHQYHNKFDTEENIPDGTILNEIENLFSLAHAITFDERINTELGMPNNKTQIGEEYTYFDFAHKYMFSYPASIGFKINWAVIVFTLVLMFHELKHRMLRFYSVGRIVFTMILFMFVHFLSYLFTGLNMFTLSLVITLLKSELSWYSYYFVAFLLYGIPSLILFVSLEYSFINGTFEYAIKLDDEKATRKIKDCVMFYSCCLFSITLLGVGTFYQVRSTYMVCSALITMLVTRCVQFFLTEKCSASHKMSETKKEFIDFLVMCVTMIPFMILVIFMMSEFYEAVVPIFDRTPCEIPSESAMAVIMCVSCLLAFFVILVTIFRFEEMYHFLRKTLGIFWIMLLVMVLTGIIPPFVPEKAPKRILLLHSDHKVFDKNFGLVKNSAEMIYIASDQRCLKGFGDELASSLKPLCKDNRFCFSVHPFSLLEEYRSSLYYLDVDEIPDTSDSPQIGLTLLSKSKVQPPKYTTDSDSESSYYNVSFRLTGVEIMTFDFVMSPYIDIVDWSFDLDPLANSQTNEGYPLYNILYLFDDEPTELEFSLLLKTTSDFNPKIDHFDIVLVQHLVNDLVTKELGKAIDGFEDFVASTHDRIRWNTYPIYMQV